MKILVVSQYFWPENFRINEICLDLKARGHEVEVLTSLPNVPDGKFYEGYSLWNKGPKEYEGIPLHRVRVVPRGKSNFILLAVNCATFAINSLFHLPKLMAKSFDCVFIFQPSPISLALPGIVFAKLKKIPSFFYVQDIWPESMYFLLNLKEQGQSLFRKISLLVSASLYRGADRWFMSSRGMASRLEYMGIPSEHSHYLPNFSDRYTDTGYDHELATSLGVQDKFTVAFAGNIGRAQGIELLLEAAERTKDLPNLHWLILGDGTERERMQDLVKEKGLEERVTFTGWIPSSEVSRYLGLASALVVMLKRHPIFSITVPSKMQTYLAAGKPILAWMDGEGALVAEESGAGLSAPAEDVSAFCERLQELKAMSADLRLAMGQRGQAYCAEHFGRDKLMDWLSEYLEKETNALIPSKRKA